MIILYDVSYDHICYMFFISYYLIDALSIKLEMQIIVRKIRVITTLLFQRRSGVDSFYREKSFVIDKQRILGFLDISPRFGKDNKVTDALNKFKFVVMSELDRMGKTAGILEPSNNSWSLRSTVELDANSYHSAK